MTSTAIPHDLDLEADILGGLVANPSLPDLEALARRDPNIFYNPAHRELAGVLIELIEDPASAVALGTITERLAHRRGATITATRAELNRLIGQHRYFGLSITTVLDTLERYHRARKMLELLENLRGHALNGLDWHETAASIAELANQNGSVVSPSTLELIELDTILRGDPPEVEPFWLRRDDNTALLYPGRVHDLHAEPSVGKTWVALEVCRQVLTDGGNALYFDLEDSAYGITDRLLKIGVPRDDLYAGANRFAYVQCHGSLNALERADLDRICERIEPDVVVIDGVAESLARNGYDENSNTDVISWSERLARPMARRGAAVLLLDHLTTKNVEHRGRGARGASAKLALIDGASYEVRLAQAFSRRRAGLLKLVVNKDRPGMVGAIGECVAHVRIVPEHDGATVTVDIETPPPPDERGFRPTGLMERISEALERAGRPIDAGALRFIGGKAEARKEALGLLVLEGFAEEVTDVNNKRRKAYRHVKAFTEADDHARRRAAQSSGKVIAGDFPPPPEPPEPELPYDDEPF